MIHGRGIKAGGGAQMRPSVVQSPLAARFRIQIVLSFDERQQLRQARDAATRARLRRAGLDRSCEIPSFAARREPYG